MIPRIKDELVRLSGLLQGFGEPAALVGGIAINVRVSPRPTEDVDILLVVPPGREVELLRLAREHGYACDDTETAQLIVGGLVQVWGPPDREAGMGLDIMFSDSPFTLAVIARATQMEIMGVRLPIASIEDLLLMKLEANRPEDVEDILAIKDVWSSRLDRAYVDDTARHLGLEARLALYFS